jgi:hypothetical protein
LRHEEIQNNNCDHFNWGELLEDIEDGQIIPVIGHGLYWIEKQGKEVLLYDYLADKLEEKYGITSPHCANHRFYTVVLECLKKNIKINRVVKELKDIVELEELIPCNPLIKLSRIRAFNLFITTAYDEFLFKALKTVRKGQVDRFAYSPAEKYPGDQFGECLKDPSYTLLFHIFGDFSYGGTVPSLTEAHILETILKFKRDLEEEQRSQSRNKFSTFLKDKSFLFIGCGYDDWLFRLFIRGVANEEYLLQQNPHPNKFISDDLLNKKKDPFNELSTFLKNFRSEVYYLCNGKEFVDVLFKKLEGDHRDQLIPLPGYPGKVFISFIRANESAAKRLAANLKEEGVDVWLEDIEPGDPVDKEINKTIGECPIFIPLISSESKSLDAGNGKLRYHIREWEWAYSNHINDRNPKRIIPVKIDGIDWMFPTFDDFSFVSIPGGDKENEGFEKLINKLKEPLI